MKLLYTIQILFNANTARMIYVVRKVMNGYDSNGLSRPLNKLMFCFKLAHAAREPQSILLTLISLPRNIEKEYSTSHPVGKLSGKVKRLFWNHLVGVNGQMLVSKPHSASEIIANKSHKEFLLQIIAQWNKISNEGRVIQGIRNLTSAFQHKRKIIHKFSSVLSVGMFKCTNLVFNYVYKHLEGILLYVSLSLGEATLHVSVK